MLLQKIETDRENIKGTSESVMTHQVTRENCEFCIRICFAGYKDTLVDDKGQCI